MTVTLDIKRNVTTISLQYVQELWEQFAEEFDIPFLTAVIDSIVIGSLIIAWLVPPDVADKIVASAHKSTPFFQKHHIVSVSIDVYNIVCSNKVMMHQGLNNIIIVVTVCFFLFLQSHTTLGKQLAVALKDKDEEITNLKELLEELESKVKDLEDKLEKARRKKRVLVTV